MISSQYQPNSPAEAPQPPGDEPDDAQGEIDPSGVLSGPKVKLTNTTLIKDRIEAGRKTCAPFAAKARNEIARFLHTDPEYAASVLGSTVNDLGRAMELLMQPEGGMLDSATAGRTNYLLVNILVKLYAVAVNDPDFDIRMTEGTQEGSDDIVRQTFRHIWNKNDWTECDKCAALMCYIVGMGFQSFFWNEEGPQFEIVMPWDMSVDPHVTTTTWHKIRYFAKKISLPLEVARAKYPSIRKFLTVGPNDAGVERSVAEVWVYFDKTTECHLYEGRELLFKTENKYQEIPLLRIMGEINPLSPWRISDVDIAAPQQEILGELMDRLNDQAQNGGSVTFINQNALGDEAQQTALLEDQSLESFYPITSSIPANEVAFRLPADPLGPALMEAIQLQKQGLDEGTAVNQFQRGALSDQTKTATEVAIMSRQSGARGVATRIQYERFCQQKAEKLLFMLKEFSGVETDEDFTLWEALQAIASIKVVESSTTYLDPALEQQSRMQLMTMFAELAPVLQAQGVIVNLKKFAEDVLRAFQVRDAESYFIPMPPMAPPGQPGQPGQGVEQGQGAQGGAGQPNPAQPGDSRQPGQQPKADGGMMQPTPGQALWIPGQLKQPMQPPAGQTRAANF